MPGDRDQHASPEWDDAGWDQEEFWQRHAGASPTEPPDATQQKLNAVWDELANGPDEDKAPRRQRIVPVFRALVYPLIFLGAATRRGLRRVRLWARGTPGQARTGSKPVAVAILVILMVSVAWAAVAGLPEPAINSAPGPAIELSPGESSVAPDPSLAPQTEATPTAVAPTTAAPTPSRTAPRPTPSLSRTPRSPRPNPNPPSPRSSTPAPSRPPADSNVSQEFRFSSRVSGKSFGVWSSSDPNGTRIVAIGTGGPSTRWRLVGVGSGFFNIVNVGTCKALDNPDGTDSLGAPMQHWTLIGKGNHNQQWRFVDVGAGYRLIINRASGMALDLRHGETADGTMIQQWTAWRDNPNQQWRLVIVS